MKKIIFICIVSLIITQNIFSQNAGRRWTVQFNPFLMFSDIFIDNASDSLFIMDLEGQYKINNSSNISLTLSFLYNDRVYYTTNYETNVEYVYKVNYYQVGFKPMYIHRPFETGLRGFYLGIYPNLGFRFSKVDENNKFFTELGFGFNLGYKWVFRSGLTMQISGGIGKTFSIPPKTTQDGFINSDGRITIIRTDLSICDFKIGYSF
jgi:hypothetical protein